MKNNPLRLFGLFSGFSDERLEEIQELLLIEKVPGKKRLFHNNDRATHVFMVYSGKVVLTTLDQDGRIVELARLTKMGSLFGEECFLQDPKSEYEATASTLEETIVFKLPRYNVDKFINITGDLGLEFQRVAFEKASIKAMVSAMSLFQGVSIQKRYLVGSLAHIVTYPEGTIISTQGVNDEQKYFSIITRGKVDILINGELKAVLRPGDYFGELSLVTNNPHAATVVAKQDCNCIIVRGDDFRALFGDEKSVMAEFKLKVFGKQIDFQTFIQHIESQKSFAEYCRSEMSDENINFIVDVEKIEGFSKKKVKKELLLALGLNVEEVKNVKNAMIRMKCEQIFQKYICDDAIQQISMEAKIRESLLQSFRGRQFDAKMFQKAKALLMEIMENDSFQRYKNSSTFFDLLETVGVYT